MPASILAPLFASTADTSVTVDAATFSAILLDLELAGELMEMGADHFASSYPAGQLNLHRDTLALVWVYDPQPDDQLTISECFGQWDKYRAEYGIADYLRCAAMSAFDAGHPRGAYLDEAVRREYKKSTAARCWAYIRNEGK